MQLKLKKWKKDKNNYKTKMFTFLFLLINLSTFLGIHIPSISALTEVKITINPNKIIGVNNFSPGFMLDHDWNYWSSNPVSKELTHNANFKIVRIIDFKSTSIKPCIYWDEKSQTGKFDWRETDKLVKQIFEVGAQPLVTLGSFSGYNSNPSIPKGMFVDPSTGLPRFESFANYCVEWVKHFRDIGIPIRYIEIFNEAWYFFFKGKWGVYDYAKLSNYVKLFNTVTIKIREISPSVRVGTDSSTLRGFLDYFIYNGKNLGFFSFHKYDSGNISDSDSTTFKKAEEHCFKTTSSYYSPQEAKQLWYNKYKINLPVIISETNLSYLWKDGTDPRIQKLQGAVWTALMLRSSILNGIQYSIYYRFSSSKNYEAQKQTGGYGFGMINSDNDMPWYPYYVHQMIGTNLAVGDKLVETKSSSSSIATLAWIHKNKLILLIICKNSETMYASFQGLQGSVTYYKIDKAVSWTKPKIQSGAIDITKTLQINGYTILLLSSQ